MRRLMERAAQ